MTKLLRTLRLAPLLLAAAPLAQAHPGHAPFDFVSGLLHPLTGWDHLVAMVGVGLWAAQLGGRARWLVPLAFVGVMALGAVLAISGFGAASPTPVAVATGVVISTTSTRMSRVAS